ncbi:MAG: NfeD family protein [Tannerellaceae bacterium]|nr:NfeD family protein [Tannerellaceae bacterium]
MLFTISIIAFLMLLAIFLILLEIFLLPGITIAGIGGAIFAVGGLAYAYMEGGSFIGNITLISSIIIFLLAFLWLMRKDSFHRVSLKTDVDSKLTSTRELGIEPGDEGVTLSRLAPIGKARIKDVVVEAKAVGELIDEETPVVVIRVDGYNVLVKVKEDNTIN